MSITLEQLKELLAYDPKTGLFTWRVSGHKRLKDRQAGWMLKGYLMITVARQRFAAHRLAWFYVTGNWPRHHIDHIDRNPLNNAFSNLREASNAQNMRNAAGWNNTSGVKGVTWDRSKGKWYAYITVNGKMKALGRYDTLEDAAEVRRAAAEKYHGEFARHG